MRCLPSLIAALYVSINPTSGLMPPGVYGPDPSDDGPPAAQLRPYGYTSDPQDAMITYITPGDDGRAEKAIVDLLQCAHHSIRMQSAGLTDWTVAEELVAAKARGVDVALALDNSALSAANQKAIIAKLSRCGVRVAVGKSRTGKALLSSRFIVVDGMFVQTGTYDYDGSMESKVNTIDIVPSGRRAEIFLVAWHGLWLAITGHMYEP